jgi:hypothetical protein|tara:strand:+ start:1647 stop:1946 length:300 start_codon:yes stop_codon:yes gene_type:complete
MVANNKSRLGSYTKTIVHKGKTFKTSVGDKSYEALFSGINKNRTLGYQIGQIPAGYDTRPDLIADLFYGSSLNWWKFCEDNNIFDVFEDLNSGTYIYLP